jgi:hypothetical protein
MARVDRQNHEKRKVSDGTVETELKSLLYEQNFWYPGTFIIFKNLYKTKKKKKKLFRPNEFVIHLRFIFGK